MTKTNDLPWINGWNETKFFEAIERENGWKYSVNAASCAYRSDTGSKCMVGVFIPDSHYKPTMEGLSAKVVLRSNVLQKYMPLSNILMDKIQSIHDDAFESKLAEIDFKNHFIKEFNLFKKEYNYAN